ncbi:nuclear transport factor 2 family protein [Seonamhaeicola maritimus]|uniref:nuclear transport factor 2 family protein n=1 Tax=Seonamhaeicola maritimus TaxID=2591822 RepID=UPI00249442E9|nr:nuclear transport factor 2 family protein [Seonamhaeicola maritimus]
MKKLLLLGLVLSLFFSCQNKPQRYFAESAETATLKAGIAAYESGDWDTWRSYFIDTAKIYVNSIKPVGLDERAKDLAGMTSAMSSYGFNHDKEYIEMVIDKEDETWVYYWATHIGTFAATNKELSMPVHLAVQFVDGKIAEEHVYFDATTMNTEFAAVAAMTDNDKTIMESINTFIDEFLNKKDSNSLNNLLAEDYSRYINDEKVASGAEELRTSIDPFFKGFSDFNIELLHTSTIVNNAIFVHWKMTGTHDGTFAETEATGNKVSVNGLSRLQYNDEAKLVMEHIYFDQLSVMTQIGKTLN